MLNFLRWNIDDKCYTLLFHENSLWETCMCRLKLEQKDVNDRVHHHFLLTGHTRSCERPDDIRHGFFKGNTSFTFGSTVEYFCDDKYWLKGDAVLTCQSDGKWNPWKTPRCIKSINHKAFNRKNVQPHIPTTTRRHRVENELKLL